MPALATGLIAAPDSAPEQNLVVIFLRGGADGLNILVPHGDDAFYRARPTIGRKKDDLVNLDGFFGLHPALSSWERLWKDGTLAAVHCAGSEDTTHSHFEAQDFMEHGGLIAGGWLGRFLRNRPDAATSPLGAIALGSSLPEVLRGAPSCAAISSIDDFTLDAPPAFTQSLTSLYSRSGSLLGPAGASALAALDRIQSLSATKYTPADGADYDPKDDFASGLREIARLIKARVGLQAATIDLGGWDSHITNDSLMAGSLARLGKGLTSFTTDLGAHLASTTILVMTEFGRRVAENSALGTDHGAGSVMFVAGGGVKGGRQLTQWPGLTEALTGPGDVPIVTNYRNVIAPTLTRLSPKTDIARIFPGFSLDPLPLFA